MKNNKYSFVFWLQVRTASFIPVTANCTGPPVYPISPSLSITPTYVYVAKVSCYCISANLYQCGAFFLGGKWRPQSISVALDAVCESRLLGTNLPPEAAFLGTRFRSPSNAENAPFLFSLSLSFSFASNDICSQAPVDGLVRALSRTSSPVHPIALGRTSGSKKKKKRKEKKKWEKEIVRLARIAHSESTWPVRRRRFVASNCIEQK